MFAYILLYIYVSQRFDGVTVNVTVKVDVEGDGDAVKSLWVLYLESLSSNEGL